MSQKSTVIVSTDIPQNNPELQEAIKQNYTILHRSDLLLALLQDKKALAVTGTHGKTTISSLLTHVLQHACWDPAFAVGGVLLQSGSNASYGKGEYFVIEADESDATFLKYPYHAAIVSNIDSDHVAHYGSMEALIDGFSSFMKKSVAPELLFYCIDDPTLSSLKPEGTSYGFQMEAQWRASNYKPCKWSSFFDIHYKGKTFYQVECSLIGKHNVLNSLAVFGLALTLGVDETRIREALKNFKGVKRRMEKKAEVSSVLIIDDYGHHPTEVAATLQALRLAVCERRIIAVFQPHRYSRMQHCMNELKTAFINADITVITDIYTAGEVPIEGVSIDTIVKAAAKEIKNEVSYIPKNCLIDQLAVKVRPHDVVIFFGAGDSTKMCSDFAKHLQYKGVKKLSLGILYGGKSLEHEVSVRSQESIVANLSSLLYDIKRFYIGKNGHFSLEEASTNKERKEAISLNEFKEILSTDLFIPVCHGPFGEDGIIQGFLETLGKAYVGCDVRSASFSMDKAFTKWVAEAHGIATAPFVAVNAYEWQKKRESVLKGLFSKLQYPLFVKPSHLGSSVGVSKAVCDKTLFEAIENAFAFDTDIIIEQEIKGREIEFAVLGNNEVEVAQPGEILTGGQIYSYDAKYSKTNSAKTTTSPDLSDAAKEEGRELAAKMYRAAGCKGLARVDFFLDSSSKYWLNEINPFPGFTTNSLYPKMWEQSGISFTNLLDTLIILALEKKRTQDLLHGVTMPLFTKE